VQIKNRNDPPVLASQSASSLPGSLMTGNHWNLFKNWDIMKVDSTWCENAQYSTRHKTVSAP